MQIVRCEGLEARAGATDGAPEGRIGDATQEAQTHLFTIWLILDILHVDLKRGKDRVVEADVHADEVEANGRRFVSLKRARDRQPRGSVSVEDVHQFLLFDCPDHHGTPARVGCHVLARDDAAHPCLPIGLRMNAPKHCLSAEYSRMMIFPESVPKTM